MFFQFQILSILLSVATFAHAVEFEPSYSFPQKEFPKNDNYTEKKCINTYGQPLEGLDYEVCEQALLAAKKMADLYAQQAGRHMSCLDAMNQGIGPSFDENKFPSFKVKQEAKDKYKNDDIDSAKYRGEKKAETEAVADAHSDVFNHFDLAAGQGLNNYTEIVQDPTMDQEWKGFEDAYKQTKYYPIEYLSHAIQERWTRSFDNWEDKLTAAHFVKFHDNGTYSPTRICKLDLTVMDKEGQDPYPVWSFFEQEADLGKHLWQHGKFVFGYFINDQENEPYRSYYVGIENLKHEVTEYVPVEVETEENNTQKPQPTRPSTSKPDLTFIPPKDAPKLITPQKTKPVTVVKKIPADLAAAYKRMFRDYFIHAYNYRYAIESAQKTYPKSATSHFRRALSIGETIGLSYARDYAFAQAFGNRYKTISYQAYKDVFGTTYTETFNKEKEYFEDYAVLDISNFEIVGDHPDGHFRQNEEIKARFKVRNLGLKTANMWTQIENANDLHNYVHIYDDFDIMDIPGLAEITYETQILGKIIAQTGSSFSIPIVVSGGLTINHYDISSRQVDTVEVEAVAQLEDTSMDLRLFNPSNPHKSTIQIYVTVVNPSSTQKTVPFRATAAIDQYFEDQVEIAEDEFDMTGLSKLGMIEGNEHKPVTLSSFDLDTWQLITNGKVEGVVQVCATHEFECDNPKKFSKKISGDKKQNILKYFDLIAKNANKRIYADDLFNQMLLQAEFEELNQSRIQDLILMIDEYFQDEDIEKIKWKKHSEVSKSLLGQIYKMYILTSNHHNANVGYYDQLGLVLADHASKVPSFFGMGRRKKFLEAIARFAPSVSTRVKDYK